MVDLRRRRLSAVRLTRWGKGRDGCGAKGLGECSYALLIGARRSAQPRRSWCLVRASRAFFRGEKSTLSRAIPSSLSFASICPMKRKTEGSKIKPRDNGANFAQTPSVDRKASRLTANGSGQGSAMHARSHPDAIGEGLAWLPGSGRPLRPRTRKPCGNVRSRRGDTVAVGCTREIIRMQQITWMRCWCPMMARFVAGIAARLHGGSPGHVCSTDFSALSPAPLFVAASFVTQPIPRRSSLNRHRGAQRLAVSPPLMLFGKP